MSAPLGRLGRIVNHDPRSRSFSVVHAPDRPLMSAVWKLHGAPFDQGEIGSCTCNAMGHAKMTEPLRDPALVLTEADCVALYSEATRIDRIRGCYPPDDTGSSGLAAAKAAKRRGWISGYRHAFTLRDALRSLADGPGLMGVNWYAGFDKPHGSRAELRIAGGVRGGHELAVTEIHVKERIIRGPNSWGSSWGDRGFYSMSFDTLERLLAEQGDYTVPIL